MDPVFTPHYSQTHRPCQSPTKKDTRMEKKKKTPAGKLSSNHLTCDSELTNTGRTHHSFKSHKASSFYCVNPHTHTYTSTRAHTHTHSHVTHVLSVVEAWGTWPCC